MPTTCVVDRTSMETEISRVSRKRNPDGLELRIKREALIAVKSTTRSSSITRTKSVITSPPIAKVKYEILENTSTTDSSEVSSHDTAQRLLNKVNLAQRIQNRFHRLNQTSDAPALCNVRGTRPKERMPRRVAQLTYQPTVNHRVKDERVSPNPSPGLVLPQVVATTNSIDGGHNQRKLTSPSQQSRLCSTDGIEHQIDRAPRGSTTPPSFDSQQRIQNNIKYEILPPKPQDPSKLNHEAADRLMQKLQFAQRIQSRFHRLSQQPVNDVRPEKAEQPPLAQHSLYTNTTSLLSRIKRKAQDKVGDKRQAKRLRLATTVASNRLKSALASKRACRVSATLNANNHLLSKWEVLLHHRPTSSMDIAAWHIHVAECRHIIETALGALSSSAREIAMMSPGCKQLQI
ncbi:hypothetical protein H257_00055 [Aphanomyces astaci]|uniref:Uncharacterized protein n=1 Tax=Aphanomyces astaci TaxID=112090 RepID=W4HAZ5_APHAT|nr:hypothetical protein H257_00055 [Aphanomyces astaci]ETV88449.1 hypothetical protein H257_00055 [Aphanomyces astaci]|eukprot:XP_009820849.1 hypothetical protein H257_00055 [Aphanomyces astaci]